MDKIGRLDKSCVTQVLSLYAYEPLIRYFERVSWHNTTGIMLRDG